MRKPIRAQHGQAILPVVLLATMVIGVLGIFAFEVTRAVMVREQLRSATESAALAGTAALAGSSQLDPVISQTRALDAARSVFTRNDVFGAMLSQVESDFASKPAPGHVKLKFEYLDPKNNDAVVPIGDPRAKVLRVEAKYGYTPLFAAVVSQHDGVVPVEAQAQGGVGDLDIVLCFDVSGSMDDETLMTHVRRRWDPAAGRIQYDVVGQGKLAGAHGAVPPLNLQFGPDFNPELRGPSESGTPPGNFPPGTAPTTGFTDAVVNIDEQNSFAGVSVDGFDFPNVATLVEAARGNLENATVFHDSQADTTLGSVVTPRSGYKAKYLEVAKKHIHPLAEAQEASKNFFTLMNKNANTHFGMVAFNENIGSSPEHRYGHANIASNFPAGLNGTFPLPGIDLEKPEPETNFADVMGKVDPLVAFGGTNIGGSASRAVNMFAPGSRPNAKKAIIVFTDGLPNAGFGGADPMTSCRNAANAARAQGIAVYTVGLALNPALLPQQRIVLGDDNATGMAAIAGNGGKFFPVTSSSNLNSAFANIARHLSSLVE